MPEAIISALAAYVGGTAAATVIVYGVMIAVSLAVSNQQRISMQRKARDAYNGSLEDRTVTIRGATVPKRIVLGRARVGGVLQYVATTGENKDKLAMVIALAGHEIDAVETVYFNDDPVTLDASGYVTSAPYNMTVPVSASAALVAGSVTLPHTPITDSVHVTYWDSTNFVSVAPAFTVVGSVVSVTGSPPAGDGTVNYQYQNTDIAVTSKARVLIHLGSPSQTVDTVLQALLPTEWDSTHKGQGIAYLVCLFGYDQDAFPSGLPNVSAVIRGAKCYDPRSATTAWTQNPALCLRHYALHALGGRLASGSLIDAEVNTAANICDASVTYTVGGVPETRALYTCGTMADTKAQPIDVIAELAQAMAGRAAFAGNKLHIRAGAYVAPVLSLGDGDFATVMSEGAEQSTPITVQPRTPREALFNIVTGSFADPGQGWKVIDTPRVEATAYITEDGTELPLEVQWNAVNHVGQCQQLSAVMLRQARQALTIVATFKLSAYAVELFDTVAITCTRYGWSAKAFEVLGRKWSIGGGIELTLRETASSVYDFGTAFDAVDAAPNTLLPSPLVVPAVTGLSAASGTEWLMRQADGSIVSRLHVSWTAVTEEAVAHGGHIEVRYGQSTEPESTWTSVDVDGSDASVTVAGVQDSRYYIIKARARNSLVAGAWCTQIGHTVIGKSAAPGNVAGLTATNVNGDVHIVWTPSSEADYSNTELRFGATWAGAALVTDVNGSSFVWAFPGVGTYTVWAAHMDTSGHYSGTPASVSVTTTYPAGYVNLLWGAQNGQNSAGPGVYGNTIAVLKSGSSNPYGLQPGEVLSLSANLWQDATSLAASQNASLFLYCADSGGTWHETISIFETGTTAVRHSGKMTLGSAANMYTVGLGLYHQGNPPNTTGTIYADLIQVERGNVATQYTPGAQPGATVGAEFGVNIAGQAVTNDIADRAVSDGINTSTSDTTGSTGSPGAYVRSSFFVGPEIVISADDQLDIYISGVHEETFWSTAAYAEVEIWFSWSATFGGAKTEITTIHKRFNMPVTPSGSTMYVPIDGGCTYTPGADVTRTFWCLYYITFFDSSGATKTCAKDFISHATWDVVTRKR